MIASALRATAARCCIAAAICCASTACGSPQSPRGVTADDAIVHITSNVRDADVYLDGRLLAPLSALGRGVAVEPGSHRLELRREEYFSSYLEFRVARGEHKTLAMAMAGILP
jgi:hypothetical protein